jgi:membrane peptidoglycan carboxypeptidase
MMQRLIDRRNLVLGRMEAVGFIDEAQLAASTAVVPVVQHPAGAERLREPPGGRAVLLRARPQRPGAHPGRAGAGRDPAGAPGPAARRRAHDPHHAGPGVQRAVQAAADEQIPREDPFQAATAINSVEPGTGKIKAMAVNRYYSEQDLPGHSKVNLATGGSSGMQAGSTFKPFILTAALQQGIPLGLDIYSPNRYISDVFEGYDDEGNLVPYSLSNAGDSETGGGTYDLRTGTWQSVNTFYVQLQERTGIEQPAALAEAMGLKWFKGGSPSEPLQRVPSFVLGVNEISPLSLAAAYATYPAHGRFCPATAVLEVLDAAGQPLELTQEPAGR